MFDKINGPTNPMAGPAQGHSTEQGDSWHTAVGKINKAFEAFKRAIEGGPGVTDAPDDAALGERLSHIEDALAALQITVDAMKSAAPAPAPIADVKPPETPPPAAVIAQQSPAPVATDGPGVVTTATTFIGAGGPAA